MSHYKPYPAYKDSGVEWLGRVPEHWGIRAVKTLARLDGGAGFPDDEQGQSDNPIPFFKVAELASGLRYTENTVTEETAKRLGAKIFPPSTLVFAKVGAALLLNRRCLLENPACLDNNMMALLPGAYDSQWLFWIFSTLDMGRIANPGAVPSINQEQVGNIRLGVPPLVEQRVIARNLDRETARIDALVAKKTRFIELLREKRQALITHAVTKGLDPNVKMKDSGVEWLGEVPEHWETKRAAAMFREVARPGVADLPVLSISIHSGVSDEELSADERDRKVSLIEDREKYKRVCPGDLAYNMMRAWQGAFGAVMVDGLVSPAYVVAEPRARICTEYVELLLRTPVAVEEMRRFSRGIADFRLRMYWEAFRDVVLLSPPYEEQLAIVEFVRQESLRIDGLIAKTDRSITLLKERRSALITAAVTGQIDLREAV